MGEEKPTPTLDLIRYMVKENIPFKFDGDLFQVETTKCTDEQKNKLSELEKAQFNNTVTN